MLQRILRGAALAVYLASPAAAQEVPVVPAVTAKVSLEDTLIRGIAKYGKWASDELQHVKYVRGSLSNIEAVGVQAFLNGYDEEKNILVISGETEEHVRNMIPHQLAMMILDADGVTSRDGYKGPSPEEIKAHLLEYVKGRQFEGLRSELQFRREYLQLQGDIQSKIGELEYINGMFKTLTKHAEKDVRAAVKFENDDELQRKFVLFRDHFLPEIQLYIGKFGEFSDWLNQWYDTLSDDPHVQVMELRKGLVKISNFYDEFSLYGDMIDSVKFTVMDTNQIVAEKQKQAELDFIAEVERQYKSESNPEIKKDLKAVLEENKEFYRNVKDIELGNLLELECSTIEIKRQTAEMRATMTPLRTMRLKKFLNDPAFILGKVLQGHIAGYTGDANGEMYPTDAKFLDTFEKDGKRMFAYDSVRQP
jgi:hypothetical protein